MSGSATKRGANGGGRPLTDSGLITLEYIEPPLPLSLYVTTFYYFRCDEVEINDIQPAAVGSLVFFLKGRGKMQFDGRAEPSHPVSLLAPFSYAVPFEVEGPFHCVGAALSPLGWASLTGLDASRHRDTISAAEAVFGPAIAELGERFRTAYAAGSMAPPDMCAAIADFLLPRLTPLKPRHMLLMAQIHQWLSRSFNPPVEELAQTTGYSQRQVQRLVERFFGVTPKLLVRKYRALRVAALLQDPATDEEQAADLLNQFYDQSHLIREVRLFAGRTPARLGDSEKPILEHLLDVRNFREINPRVAGMPPATGDFAD